MEYFDGSYLEGFEHNAGLASKMDYIAKGIRTVQAAAAQGKTIVSGHGGALQLPKHS